MYPNKADEDATKIYIELTDIIGYSQISQKILNLNRIFKNLMDFFSNKSLDEFCRLKHIEYFLKDIKAKNKYFKGILPEILDKYHQLIHNKGMTEIRRGRLKEEDIIKFIAAQDVYYYEKEYFNSEFRDPEILKYISLTNKKNIELINDNNLSIWDLFSRLRHNEKIKFWTKLKI